MVSIMHTATKQQQEALFTCSDLTFVNKIHNGGVTKAPSMNLENVN